MIGVLLKLLPRGLYDLEEGSHVRASLEGEAAALEDCEEVLEALLREVFPEETEVLLPSWERVYDLRPSGTATVEERQQRLLAKIRLRPSLSRTFVVSTASEILGYDPILRETTIFRVGASPIEMVGVTRIGVLSDMYRFHLDIDPAQTDIDNYDREPLETLIDPIKPGHTKVYLGFSGPFRVGINQIDKDKL